MSKKAKLLTLLSLSTLIIFACTLPSEEARENDPNIVFTAAAQTAAVQLTEVARANNAPTQEAGNTAPTLSPPTLIPPTSALPTLTPTEDLCNKADFITDVTVPDETVFSPGENFTKTWRVKNIGACPWTSDYDLVFVSGDQMSGASPKAMLGTVAPGDTVDISVNLTAPTESGNYVSSWQIRNNKNVLFAKIYVQIKVQSGPFAVTSVKLYAPNGGIAADITASGKGKVEYHWIIRENGQSDITTAVEEITYSGAGEKTVSTTFTCPHSGNFTAYIYIDEPNHQEFGSASFTCP
ncbi:MAG: hypothetical protein HN392_00340 [Anaerolineae bacterium]|jgi:hypothetical protein|nr:hypothetical protein [Anaerolineae bacterium]MBT7191290.1 hypothetical protein [Anaerolineae bacterium]MBT7991461.1 hypothetical protein [Anaerolineae bacterium]